MIKRLTFLTAGAALLAAGPAFAQDAVDAGAVPAQSVFVFNTLLFLIGGFLVMWMAAGFAMLEAGLVRSKNVTMQLTKNVALFAIAALTFYILGYNLMYPGDGNWMVEGVIGTIAVKDLKGGANLDTGYSDASDFFFQLMFCATTASIVSGTLAERIKLWPFLLFTVALTAVIYPIEASWQWGGGFLSEIGFSDFAGSTLVHAAGGWAALAGALILGPRLGKYKDGRTVPMPGSNMPLATLGTFVLWLGWFGFNGGSQLALGSLADADAVAMIFANTNTAAAGGAVAAMIGTQLYYGKIDLTMMLNGALAGLVSITAEPLTPTLGSASLIGAIGGLIVVFAVPLLDKLKIDDVVGAIPVHLICGIWGTIAVVFTNPDTNIVSQLTGIAAVGAFVFIMSGIVWFVLKATMGIRVSEEDEIMGLDKSELGLEAYPEFGKGSQIT
ncbi:MAG: Amt family ammonium transporter [Paracoccaceae bacterium]|jgi:Amt family ammonium transporter